MVGFLQERIKGDLLIVHIHCTLTQTLIKRVSANRKDLKQTALVTACMASSGCNSCTATVNTAESSAQYNSPVGFGGGENRHWMSLPLLYSTSLYKTYTRLTNTFTLTWRYLICFEMKQFARNLSKLWACKVVISSYQPPTASPSGNTHFIYCFQNSKMTIDLVKWTHKTIWSISFLGITGRLHKCGLWHSFPHSRVPILPWRSGTQELFLAVFHGYARYWVLVPIQWNTCAPPYLWAQKYFCKRYRDNRKNFCFISVTCFIEQNSWVWEIYKKYILSNLAEENTLIKCWMERQDYNLL